MTQNFSTSPTVLVYWASTGVRWSTQLLILTSLWWGAMCSHYWLLRTSVDQHALEYKVWWILHVLIYLPIQLHQVRTCIIQYCYTLNVSNTHTNAAAIIASLTDITSHTVIISTSQSLTYMPFVVTTPTPTTPTRPTPPTTLQSPFILVIIVVGVAIVIVGVIAVVAVTAVCGTVH